MNKRAALIIPITLLFSAYVYASTRRKRIEDYSVDNFPDMKREHIPHFKKLVSKL